MAKKRKKNSKMEFPSFCCEEKKKKEDEVTYIDNNFILKIVLSKRNQIPKLVP
jgi:hypothetical protein